MCACALCGDMRVCPCALSVHPCVLNPVCAPRLPHTGGILVSSCRCDVSVSRVDFRAQHTCVACPSACQRPLTQPDVPTEHARDTQMPPTERSVPGTRLPPSSLLPAHGNLGDPVPFPPTPDPFSFPSAATEKQNRVLYRLPHGPPAAPKQPHGVPPGGLSPAAQDPPRHRLLSVTLPSHESSSYSHRLSLRRARGDSSRLHEVLVD